MLIKQRLARLKALSFYEWRLLLASMLLLPLAALVLDLFGFKRTQTFMSRFVRAERGTDFPEVNTLQEARGVARMVSVAAGNGLYRANCLKQSLVLWWLLARLGISSEIQIGVNREEAEAINAHAWVECGGQALIDPEYIRQQFSAFENN